MPRVPAGDGQNPVSDVQNTRREPLSPESRVRGRVKAKATREGRIAAGKSAFRTPLEVAQDNPTSKRYAINAKCYDCQGGIGADPGWQWAIGNCAIADCPLYPHRPYQRKQGQPPEGRYRVKSR